MPSLESDTTSDADHKKAAHRAKGYFIEEGKLWKLSRYTPLRATAHRECITKVEAMQMARVEHSKLHMHGDMLQNQLLNKIHSPLLDASISRAILKCGQCKSFGAIHLHLLLVPITRRRPFKLLVGDYLSMPNGKGGFTKIRLYTDVFSQKLWAFKSKTAKGKDTVNSLQRISQAFVAPMTFMADGGPHFNCNKVEDFCESMGTHLHIIVVYSPWINGLLEQNNSTLLNALKCLCTLGLGKDDYEKMATEDVPKNWLDHLDSIIKNLSD